MAGQQGDGISSCNHRLVPSACFKQRQKGTPRLSTISANRLLNMSARAFSTIVTHISKMTVFRILLQIRPTERTNDEIGAMGYGQRFTNDSGEGVLFEQPVAVRRPPTRYGFFAHRNPGTYWLRNDGGSQYRSEERRARGLLFQEPPRITLYPPVGGPVGFCAGLFL